MRFTFKKTALGAALWGAVMTAAGAGTPQNVLGVVRHTVPAAVSRAHFVGRHDPTAPLSLTLGLRLHHGAQLAAFLRDVQNPYSPQYHHFLTPEQFTELYGPTADEVAAVVQFLNRNGIRVQDVSPNRLLIHAVGQTSVVERALGVTVNDYTLNGRSYYASATDPRLPASLVNSVQSVLGLNNMEELHPLSQAAPVKITQHRGKPSGGAPAGYSPQQIATAYHWPAITNTANGGGVKIAVATAFTFKSSDLTGFWNQYGLPNHTVQIVPVDGTSNRTNVETTLDIQRSGAMAPGATILVYEGANAQLTTFTDVYNQVVVDNQADVMTTSWGLAESSMPAATVQTDDSIFAQAAAQGIALFAAAGDNGSSDGTSNPDTADFPSSDPYVTAAGGTTLTLNSDGSIASETAWSGSGGAESIFFGEPAWQNVRNVPQDGKRQSSDIAMDADPNTGYSVLYGGRWAVYGGTSFVAPELAGLFAVRSGQIGRLGQVNALLYGDAATSNYATDFFDITVGSNGAFNAGPYWDHPTGWGSPNASSLILHIN